MAPVFTVADVSDACGVLALVTAITAVLFPLSYSDCTGIHDAYVHTAPNGILLPDKLRLGASLIWIGLAILGTVTWHRENTFTFVVFAMGWLLFYVGMLQFGQENCPGHGLHASYWIGSLSPLFSSWAIASHRHFNAQTNIGTPIKGKKGV